MANSFTQAGDYFVSALDGNDSNAGTADAPFKTITAAVSALSNSKIKLNCIGIK